MLQVKLNSDFTKEISLKPELLLHTHFTMNLWQASQLVICTIIMMQADSSLCSDFR